MASRAFIVPVRIKSTKFELTCILQNPNSSVTSCLYFPCSSLWLLTLSWLLAFVAFSSSPAAPNPQSSPNLPPPPAGPPLVSTKNAPLHFCVEPVYPHAFSSQQESDSSASSSLFSPWPPSVTIISKTCAMIINTTHRPLSTTLH